MDMKNVKNANYFQADNEVKEIVEKKGVLVIPSPSAWDSFEWTRKYFKNKPKEGYFIWVKEQINHPVFTCVSLVSEKINQDLDNLVVVEEGLKVNLEGCCFAKKKNLKSSHNAKGVIVLKKNASLSYNHLHSWGKEDLVETDYNFILENNSNLEYVYKSVSSPKKMKINSNFDVSKGGNASVSLICDCKETETKINESLFLKGENSSGVIKLRLVGRRDSKVSAKSSVVTESPGKGHLDCQGLLVDDNSEVLLIPELVCKNKDAQVTHEASIGKISEEELNYLRMRGLSEEEAINLIISGFLEL
jgi:hypothetical protein